MFIEMVEAGTVHKGFSGQDLLKSTGRMNTSGRLTVMTDEGGRLVGFGRDVGELHKSMSVLANEGTQSVRQVEMTDESGNVIARGAGSEFLKDKRRREAEAHEPLTKSFAQMDREILRLQQIVKERFPSARAAGSRILKAGW